MSSDSTGQIVNGPTTSGRLGKTLTVDLTSPQSNMPLKRGSTLPRSSVVVTTAARRIQELSKAGEKVKCLMAVGSCEDPTEHPNLREITENLRALRDKWFQRAKLCILTNCRQFDSYEIRQALSMYDKVILPFEWGTAKTFATSTGEPSTVLGEITRQLSTFDHIVVQAHFFKGDLDNSTESEIKHWVKKLKEVQPREVHILDGYEKINGKKLRAVTKRQREQIAEQVAEAGLNVAIHENEPVLV